MGEVREERSSHGNIFPHLLYMNTLTRSSSVSLFGRCELGNHHIEFKFSEMATADIITVEAQEQYRVPVFLLVHCTCPCSGCPRSLVCMCSFALVSMHLLDAVSKFAYFALLADMYYMPFRTASAFCDDLCYV